MNTIDQEPRCCCDSSMKNCLRFWHVLFSIISMAHFVFSINSYVSIKYKYDLILKPDYYDILIIVFIGVLMLGNLIAFISITYKSINGIKVSILITSIGVTGPIIMYLVLYSYLFKSVLILAPLLIAVFFIIVVYGTLFYFDFRYIKWLKSELEKKPEMIEHPESFDAGHY